MRVLIVNRHYGNDHVPTGRMLSDVAAALVAAGHEVVVVTARSSYSATCAETAESAGVQVRYLRTMGEKFRLVSWLLFLIQAWIRVPFMRWDRCLLLTDPPFLAAISILLRPGRSRHSRLFWWTMDLYPEMLASSGRLPPTSALYGILRRVNGAIIQRVGGFILLGQCQLERMRAYPEWQDRNYVVVPPWDRRVIARVDRDQNRFIEKYGLQDKKIALYAGNLGEGHTFAPLVDAARELSKAGRDDWAIVFVIRGSKKQQLIDVAQDDPSVVILDYQPVDWTSDLLWAADLHLITMNADSKGLVVPSKLYGVLQTEAPVLFIGPRDADTAQEIQRYRAGMALSESCDGAAVVEAMDLLQSNRSADELGRIPADASGPERIAEFVTG